ncbi:tyrosine-type recombinase/integrase [Lentibacillus cibarius]|uniref:Tyrosine-type recombinase/integrase n=1 Tax=Lentibacillus cibarius TaxID=2583219 RepID=A0A549YFL8_9BACI|nr:tyrosine-type recombinase/integrase [Lentibacillus cibarius]TRM10676.1 tyrosine-type recombinase/integrase [Lentibacillus cibarius]
MHYRIINPNRNKGWQSSQLFFALFSTFCLQNTVGALSHLIEAFLYYLFEEAKSDQTIIAYRTSLNQFIEWLDKSENDITINQIKPIDIKEYLSYLRHQRNRSQATINKHTAALKSFFNYLEDQGTIQTNPADRIKIQRINRTEHLSNNEEKWLTKEEQERFISYLDLEQKEFNRIRNLAVVDLMLYCGLRVHEVSALKVHDLVLKGGDIQVFVLGKGSKFAGLALVQKHSKNVRRWLKYRQTLTKQIHINSPYLFVSERTGMFTERGIQKMLTKYGKLASMENITPHRFRHSFCKNLANAGTPIEVIKRLARHESVETTMIYIDSSYEEQLEALQRM